MKGAPERKNPGLSFYSGGRQGFERMKRQKPRYCVDNCPLGTAGGGFCADKIIDLRDSGIVLVIEEPLQKDVITGSILSSSFYFWNRTIADYGGEVVSKALLATTAVRRCRARRKFKKETLVLAGKQCEALASAPRADGYYITLSLPLALKEHAFMSLFVDDLNRAARLADKHGIVLWVLCGETVMEYFAPWIVEGNIKNWRGHWWLRGDR